MLFRYDTWSIAHNVSPFTINRYRDTYRSSLNLHFYIRLIVTWLHLSTRGKSQWYKPAVVWNQPQCYLDRITIRSEFVFTRHRPAHVVFPLYKPWFDPGSSTAERKSVAIVLWWNSFNKVPSLSLSFSFTRAQQKRLMSEQSKSNLDSGAIKASATSHFTIRRVHMVRTLHTRARTDVHVTRSQP